MDNLRQTQFQTSVDVVEHDSRVPPTMIGDALGGAAESCTFCACDANVEPANR